MQEDEIFRKTKQAMLLGNIGSVLIAISIILVYFTRFEKLLFIAIQILCFIIGAYINIRFVRCPVCNESILKLRPSATHCDHCGTRLRV